MTVGHVHRPRTMIGKPHRSKSGELVVPLNIAFLFGTCETLVVYYNPKSAMTWAMQIDEFLKTHKEE